MQMMQGVAWLTRICLDGNSINVLRTLRMHLRIWHKRGLLKPTLMMKRHTTPYVFGTCGKSWGSRRPRGTRLHPQVHFPREPLGNPGIPWQARTFPRIPALKKNEKRKRREENPKRKKKH